VIDPSARCTIYIKRAGTTIIKEVMEHGTGPGNFTIIIDTSLLSAGGSSRSYNVIIEGSYPGFPTPNIVPLFLEVKSIPTMISAHDYDTQLELPSKFYNAYYNELTNIMVQYSINESGMILDNGYLTYEWLGLAPIEFFVDPVFTDFYTFTVNTSDAQTTGLKVISITASYENYTTQSDFLVYLNILERETTINGETEEIYYLRPPDIWIEDPKIFSFTYRDKETSKVLGELSTATYVWEELYENGTKKEGIFGSGELTELTNKTYTLNFNTEVKPAGNYFIFVTLKKDNYDEKNVFINLKIVYRTFSISGDLIIKGTPMFIEPGTTQISVAQGVNLNFTIGLTDDSRNGINLQGATVKIYFGHTGSNRTDINEISPGLYTLTVGTGNIDTFIAPRTFIIIIYMSADNFTSQERRIIITIQMEEIWPGMPTFYFILITVSIAGIVGSAVAYRVIQQARIPKHVKKIRKIKGMIKSKKKITEVPSVPTKAQMTAKLFGEDWKEIGLSLEEALGIQDLESKKLPMKDKISKEGGED
jgi:hypothetical protein